MRMIGPGRRELGSESDEQQDRQALRSVDDQVEQLEGRRVAPMSVLQHDQARLAGSHGLDQRTRARSVSALCSFGLRSKAGYRSLGRKPQQAARSGATEGWPPVAARAALSSFASLVSGCRHGDSRRYARGGRSPATTRFGHDAASTGSSAAVKVSLSQPLTQSPHQPRLADARLAGQEDDSAAAALRLLPTIEQQLHLRHAADQRRQPGCLARCESAFYVAVGPSTCQAGTCSANPLRLWLPRSASSNKPPTNRRVLAANHDRSGIGQSLQAVRRGSASHRLRSPRD